MYNAPSMNETTSGKESDFVQLVEGTDYTVNWNENYTNFTITFKDGTKNTMSLMTQQLQMMEVKFKIWFL